MEQTTALLGTGTAGTILGVVYLLYKAFNHKRLRSSCCGKTTEVSFEVDDIHTNPMVVPQIR
jgi:hypothetical protein